MVMTIKASHSFEKDQQTCQELQIPSSLPSCALYSYLKWKIIIFQLIQDDFAFSSYFKQPKYKGNAV